jgi:ABC-type nitrate/sulfonate/bicarbonate transport system substrate-binding protein
LPLRVGVHPNNLHLFLAQDWPGAFDGLDVEMVPYSEGRNSARMLAEDRIDVCGTGSTPPILAQAAGLPVRYLAASAPRPANGGLVTAPESSIRTIADLKGARIALLDGSFHTYLLARELERAGLHLADVQRVELSPGASLQALGAGDIDAWVAMAPLLDQSLAAGRTRLLARCGDTIPNRSVFWTTRERGLSQAVLDGFVAGLMRFGETIKANPLQAAKRLAETGADAAGIAAWRDVVASRDWSIIAAGPQIGAEQQAEADTLLRHNDLAGPIDVTAALGPQGEAKL